MHRNGTGIGYSRIRDSGKYKFFVTGEEYTFRDMSMYCYTPEFKFQKLNESFYWFFNLRRKETMNYVYCINQLRR
jgi:hypothetical protein